MIKVAFVPDSKRSDEVDLYISGSKFRFIRESSGISRLLLANQAKYVSAAAIKYWENKNRVPLRLVQILANTLKSALGSDRYYIQLLNKFREMNKRNREW